MALLVPSTNATGGSITTLATTEFTRQTSGTVFTFNPAIELTAEIVETSSEDVAVLVIAYTKDSNILSVVDSKNHIWQPVGSRGIDFDSVYDFQVYMADLDGRTILTTDTITVTFNVSSAATATLHIGSNIAIRNEWDKRTQAGAADVTATAAFDLAPHRHLAIVVIGTNASGVTSSTPTNWTERADIAPTATAPGIHVYTRIVPTGEATIAAIEWYPKSKATLTGSYAVSANSATITGSGGSLFSTEAIPGDTIQVGTQFRELNSVSSATSGTSNVVFNADSAAAAGRTIWHGQRLVWACQNGAVYKYGERSSAAAPTSLLAAGSLSVGAMSGKFLPCGMEATGSTAKLLYMNGYDTVQVLLSDGATMAAISNPNTDWSTGNTPVNGVVHQGRVFLVGARDNPFTVYGSDPADHQDYRAANTATNRYQIDSSLGDRIWCLASFQGLLWFWKHPVGIFYLDDSDLSVSNWYVATKSRALGCAQSPHAVLPIDDDIMFLDAHGQFHLISAVATLGGIRDSNLTEAMGLTDYFRYRLHRGRLDTICSVWDPTNKIAYWGLPTYGSYFPTDLVSFDFSKSTREGGLPKFSVNNRDCPLALLMTRQTGTTSVGRQFVTVAEPGQRFTQIGIPNTSSTKQAASAQIPYLTMYQTPYMDFRWLDSSLEFKRKIFDALEITFQPFVGVSDDQSGDITVEVWIDGSFRQSMAFTPTNRRQRRTLQCGDGYSISLRVFSLGEMNEGELGEARNFQLLSHTIFFKAGTEDQSRTP